MNNTAYTTLLRILGLWFINHTNEKKKYKRESKKRKNSNIDKEDEIEKYKKIDDNSKLSNYINELKKMDDRREKELNINNKDNDIVELDIIDMEGFKLSSELDIFNRKLSVEDINEENTDLSRKRCKFIKNKTFRKIGYYTLNILYVIFILSIICWKPIYEILHFNKNSHFMANSFVFIIPIQYLVEINYFKTSHFYKTLSQYPKYINVVNYYARFIIIASVIAMIMSLFTFVYFDKMDVYEIIIKDKSFGMKVLFAFICAFDHFYSCCIFFCSMLTFLCIFTIHTNEINKLAKFVKNMRYDINSVYYLHKYFIELKDRYEESVDHLNIMFSTTTILGLFASYGGIVHMFIGKFVYNIFDIIYILLYIATEIIYFYSIYKVRTSIKSIRETILSGKFTRKYLKRQLFQISPLNKYHDEEDNNSGSLSYNEEEKSIIIEKRYNKIRKDLEKIDEHVNCISSNFRDNMLTLDWSIMTRLTEIPWKNFTLLGFAVENTEFIKRIFALVWIFLITSPFYNNFDLHIV